MPDVVPYGFRYHKKSKTYKSTAGAMPDFEFDFPEGFCVVCDTREQTALFVPKAPKGLVLVRDTLKYGDYSIRGFETCIAIERKNIDDLLTSVTSERERFKKELIVLSEYDRKYILVEGLESAVLCYHDNRKIHPNSIRWALASIEAKLGIPIHYAATKKDAERFVLDLFISWYKMKRSGV